MLRVGRGMQKHAERKLRRCAVSLLHYRATSFTYAARPLRLPHDLQICCPWTINLSSILVINVNEPDETRWRNGRLGDHRPRGPRAMALTEPSGSLVADLTQSSRVGRAVAASSTPQGALRGHDPADGKRTIRHFCPPTDPAAGSMLCRTNASRGETLSDPPSGRSTWLTEFIL